MAKVLQKLTKRPVPSAHKKDFHSLPNSVKSKVIAAIAGDPLWGISPSTFRNHLNKRNTYFDIRLGKELDKYLTPSV